MVDTSKTPCGISERRPRQRTARAQAHHRTRAQRAPPTNPHEHANTNKNQPNRGSARPPPHQQTVLPKRQAARNKPHPRKTPNPPTRVTHHPAHRTSPTQPPTIGACHGTPPTDTSNYPNTGANSGNKSSRKPTTNAKASPRHHPHPARQGEGHGSPTRTDASTPPTARAEPQTWTTSSPPQRAGQTTRPTFAPYPTPATPPPPAPITPPATPPYAPPPHDPTSLIPATSNANKHTKTKRKTKKKLFKNLPFSQKHKPKKNSNEKFSRQKIFDLAPTPPAPTTKDRGS